MLTVKDKIEQFKREMRSIRFYEGRMQEINDELVRLNRIMREPKPIKYGEAMGNPPNFYDLMEQEDQLRAEYEDLHNRYCDVYETLSMANEADKNMLVEIYINRKRYEEIADIRYSSRSTLKRDINRVIAKLLKLDLRAQKKGVL